MKRIIVLMTCLAELIFTSCQQKDSEIRDAIQGMLNQHPEMRLQDIYKSFYQDCFGPGHIIASREAAEAYLKQELDTCGELKDPQPIEPTGSKGRYVRVALYFVKSGKIDYDAYVEAFIAGAKAVSPQDYEAWKELWPTIAEAAAEFDLPGYEEDLEMINQALESSEGNLAFHHSRAYNDAYDPHYRIIAKERVEALFK